MAGRRPALSLTSPPTPAFLGFRFAVVVAGVSPAPLKNLQPTRLPLQGLRRKPDDQVVFVIRLLASEFVVAKFLARQDRVRCRKPGSNAQLLARCRGSI